MSILRILLLLNLACIDFSLEHCWALRSLNGIQFTLEAHATEAILQNSFLLMNSIWPAVQGPDAIFSMDAAVQFILQELASKLILELKPNLFNLRLTCNINVGRFQCKNHLGNLVVYLEFECGAL